MTESSADQWQKLVEEWEVAREAVWNASRPVHASFVAIAHGRPSSNPPDADLERLHNLIARQHELENEMSALIKRTFG